MAGVETTAQGTPRFAHLDRLKVVLTAGVIVAHAAMSYGAAGTWIYEEDSLSTPVGTALSVLVGFGVMFVLGLFFLIAGMLTTGPLRRRGPLHFLASRLSRLGIPVVLYALVVWPVLEWWINEVRGSAPSLWAFYRQEFSGSDWQSRGTGPMWFVEILLVATAGWCVWRWRFPARSTGLTLRTAVMVAAATIALLTFLVRSRFAIDSGQFLDLHVWLWPQSVTLFVLGAVGAERGWLTPVSAPILRLCRWGITGAVGLLVSLVMLSNGPESFEGGWHWEAAGLAVVEGAVAVGMSLLVLDWSRRHVVMHGRFERRASGAAYGAFVSQGPVLVALALALRPVHLAGDLKFVIVAVVGVLGSFALGALTHQHLRGRRPPSTRRGEPPLAQVGRLGRRRFGLGRVDLLGALHPVRRRSSEPGGLVAADVPALATHQGMHLADSVDAVVLRVEPADLTDQQLILQRAR